MTGRCRLDECWLQKIKCNDLKWVCICRIIKFGVKSTLCVVKVCEFNDLSRITQDVLMSQAISRNVSKALDAGIILYDGHF